MSKDFDIYFKLDKKGLENKYVIIVKGKLVAKVKDIESILDKVKRKYPKEMPFVAKVPDDRTLIL
ncbi:unnamed protein product [marine sediment metagenome]|uniref:DUF5678 domain-containing protein n=1 Tax=marine sediment metagenome TaxID=412755 RepID=X1FAC7_9ZZZZ